MSKHLRGWIEVITGSMFSGKTEDLIRRLRRAQIANQPIQCFKHAADDRYGDGVVSHNRQDIPAIAVDTTTDLVHRLDQDARVVGIDEAQFFDSSLPYVVEVMAREGRRVIVAGLDMDYLGRPFGHMPTMMAIAEEVTKLRAICARCGNPATFSQRLRGGKDIVQVGATEGYEARCRACFEPPEAS